MVQIAGTFATRQSLLQQVGQNPSKWPEFVRIYGPLIAYYLRRAGVPRSDIEDLLQDVLAILLRRLPNWHYDPSRGRFRGYVKTIVGNMTRRHLQRIARQPRGAGGTDHQNLLLAKVEESDPLDADFEQAWRRRAFEVAAERVRSQVTAASWTVFEETTIKGRTPEEVASEMGMRVGNVYVIRTRILGRLRTEVEALDE